MDWLLTDFMPHGHCYRWQPGILWTHAISDSLTALSYLAIPALLVVLARARPDLNFGGAFWLFGAFILACGTVHALEVVAIWEGIYQLTGAAKATMAAVSVPTAAVLWRLLPRIKDLPTRADYEAEIARRRDAEAEIRSMNERLLEMLEEHSQAELRTLSDDLVEAVRLLRPPGQTGTKPKP